MCQVQGKQHPGLQHICFDSYASALYEDTEGVCCLACCIQPILSHPYAWPQSMTTGYVCGQPNQPHSQQQSHSAHCCLHPQSRILTPISPSPAVAAALIMSEARRQRAAAAAPPSGLTPAEAQILTATMLLKHRGPRAVQWHPHWKNQQQVSRPGSPAAGTTEQHSGAPLCSAL